MSGPGTGTPDKSFQDRLGRVADRRAPVEASKPKVDVLPDWRENVRTPTGFAIAVAVGIVAVIAVRLVRYHAMGGTLVGENADLTMAIDFAAAGVLAFAIFAAFPYKGFPYFLAQMTGVLVMLTTMQNVVHSLPTVFNLAFSADWTEDALASTDANSLLVRGQSIALSEPEEVLAEANTKPKVDQRPKFGVWAKPEAEDAAAAGSDGTAAKEEPPVKPRVLRLN